MKAGTKQFIEKFGTHIRKIAEEFGIKRVWLFGSAVDSYETAKDYDIAIEGYPEGQFFKVYSEFDFGIKDKEVEVVDLKGLEENGHWLADEFKSRGDIIFELAK